jgi:hypothetical protein
VSETRTPAQIEAEIARTRENLAGRVDQLQDRLSPGALAAVAKDKALGVFRRKDGSLDPVRTGVAVGVAVLLVTYLVRRRRL